MQGGTLWTCCGLHSPAAPSLAPPRSAPWRSSTSWSLIGGASIAVASATSPSPVTFSSAWLSAPWCWPAAPSTCTLVGQSSLTRTPPMSIGRLCTKGGASCGRWAMGTDGRKLWINGRLVGEEEPCLTALERGFTLCDGLFETMLARGRRVFRLDDHLDRLYQGAHLLGIPLPPREELSEAVE